MEQNELKNLLSALEADNTAELNGHTAEHHFSKSFERRAISTCRGTAVAFGAPCRRRHLPLWAAVLIAALLCALVTGCAVVVYRYFTRYIPITALSIRSVMSECLQPKKNSMWAT